MNNSDDTIEDRTRDLPACSAVPQPIAGTFLIMHHKRIRFTQCIYMFLTILTVTTVCTLNSI